MLKLLSIGLAALLMSAVIHAVGTTSAQDETLAGANWTWLYSDPWGSNFSPQNQITRGGASALELKWLYPLPKSRDNPNVLRVAEGVEHPPLILNGIVYFVKGDEQIFALSAEDGRLIWTVEVPFNATGRPVSTSLVHTHGIQIVDEVIYHFSKDCTIYGFDVLTGAEVTRIDDVCSGIEGNAGFYSPSYPPSIYRNGRVLIAAPAGGASGPRGFVAGYDMDTMKLLWRWFVVPASGGVEAWGKDADGKGNVRPVSGDWGSSRSFGGGGVWTQFAIDEETGRVYFGTGNPAPLFNATQRPGPNLFTSSIIVLDAMTGELIWYYQTTPHDLGDFDCSWNTMLAEISIEGVARKVVIQGCKNGYLYMLDSERGTPVMDPLRLDGIARVNDLNANMGEEADFRAVYAAPRDRWDDEGFYMQCPSLTGAIETPNAFAYNTIFVGAKSDCIMIRPGPVPERAPFLPLAGVMGIKSARQPSNSTVYAIDASSGAIRWRYVIEDSVISGGCCMVSGEVVYFGDRNGKLYALDALNGRLLWVRRLGAVLSAFPSIGATADGEMRLFVPVSGGPAADVPGAILALGLPEGTVPERAVRPDVLDALLVSVAVLAVGYALTIRRKGRVQ